MQTSSLSQISTFAVFLPQYARGNGRFIKHEAYHSKRQRELILAKNQRYLERHRHKLKVFELYEQPSNQRIFRWPEEAPIAHHLLLWLYYRPEVHSIVNCTLDGCQTLRRSFDMGDAAQEQQHFEALLGKVQQHVSANQIWLARIYAHPGNVLRFSWSEDQGETFPGNALQLLSQPTTA